MYSSTLPASVEQAITLHAAQSPCHTAVIAGGEAMTYRQLDQAIEQQSRLLGNMNGQAFAFRAIHSLSSVILYFAVHRAGGVAVPLDQDMPESLYAATCDSLQHSVCPIGTADLLFTTGTTGQPKGVMVSHRAMVANADNLVHAQGFHAGLTFAITGPLNHVGSLSKLYTILLAGGTALILESIKDIKAFFSALQAVPGPVATFLVPASIRMLITFASDTLKQAACHMEFVETGAAPLMQSDMERFCQLLPHSRLFNTYASTETGIIATHDYNHGLRQSGCLGQPMRHSHIHFDDLGHIICSGDTLMTGYWNNEELTRQWLSPEGLRTNDLGQMDSEGRLHLTGRDDDIINVGGFKVAPTEVEEQAQASGMMDDCICVPFTHPVIGTSIQLLVVGPHNDFSKRALLLWLKQRLEAHKLPHSIETIDHIERTPNGKPNRKVYR